MPGIAGIIARGAPKAEIQAIGRSMAGALFREDGQGLESMNFDEPRGALGWVVADDKAGAGPAQVWNEARDLCVVLTGDLPGDDPAPAALRSLADRFRRDGSSALAELNGRFCGAAIDTRLRNVSIFTDRYGLNRLYVHKGTRGVFFSSEAKAILRCVPETCSFDETGLAEYFACGCPLQNRSLFEGIRLLPAGGFWTVDADGGVDEGRYFDPSEWEKLPPLDEERYLDELEAVFARAVGRCFGGGRPVGLSLTGGIDSRMIAGWLSPADGPVPCYSFNGPIRECADAVIGRRVAGVIGQPHECIDVGGDFLRDFPDLAAETIRAGDGTMDVSGAVELHVNRRAREIAPVRVTGNYGGEILRSKVAFRPGTPRHPILESGFAEAVAGVRKTYEDELRGRPLSFIAFKQVPWCHHCRFSVEQSQIVVRSPFLDNDLVRLVFQAPESLRSSSAPAWDIIRRGDPALAGIPTDRGVIARPGGLGNRLRRERQEFLAKAEYACDYGMPDWFCRLEDMVSALRVDRWFLGRQKFYHFRLWYRGPLASHVREIILDPGTLSEPVFDRRVVEAVVAGHLEGRCNATTEIHRLLSVALIRRELLDGGTA